MDDEQGTDAQAVAGINDLTTAISHAISGCADQGTHAIHWCLVADVAFEDGDRELVTMTAPNMPTWMMEAMMRFLMDESVHMVDSDDDE